MDTNYNRRSMKAAFLLVILGSALSLRPVCAQQGCTDPRATNYNPAATTNDGSCQYGPTTAALPIKAPLPAVLAETSGLQYTGQALWTFNDSGSPPELFRLDTLTGNVLQRLRIRHFSNVDWEDIAADAQHLYVGDFGNNAGSRRDLRILQIRKADIGTAAVDTVSAQAINFSYPDQTTFTPALNNHNFDCEAFFYFQDSLHIFTKNWADLRTKYYTVPATPGTHVARLRGTFNVNGLITAADLNAAGTEAALLGYNASTGATFVWLLFDFRGGRFLQGNKRRIELPNALLIGQAEGLSFVSRYRLFVSNEQLAGPIAVPARLYTFSASRWLAPQVLAQRPARPPGAFAVFPNPATHMLQLQTPTKRSENIPFVLLDAQGRVVRAFVLPAGTSNCEIELPAVPGVYLLRGQLGPTPVAQKVVVE